MSEFYINFSQIYKTVIYATLFKAHYEKHVSVQKPVFSQLYQT